MRTTLARTRRVASLVLLVLLAGAIVRLGGHRGVHAVRSLVIPGAGLIEEHVVLGTVFALAGVAATVLWLRWGADWLVVAVVAAAMVTSALLASPDAHHHLDDGVQAIAVPHPASHEFPLVVLVIIAWAWMRSALGRVPGVRRVIGRRHRRRDGIVDLQCLPPADRCRAAGVLALAGRPDAGRLGVTAADVEARCRRIGVVARARITGDPLRRDHAGVRAARALTGAIDPAAMGRFARDADRAPLGVPCSEPGWVRPLDATLAALALSRGGHHEVGEAWRSALAGPLRLRRGHRPAAWWAPLGLGAAAMAPWEHAATTALARVAGWLDTDDDWLHLRRSALGASARGGDQRDDERMIAAARLWLAIVHDPDAERIVNRPTVRRDPLACALDELATRLRIEPALVLAPSGPSDHPPTWAP